MDKLDSAIIFVGILFLSFAIFVFMNDENIFNNPTGEVVSDYHTYTKAVCNSTNYCEDYEITCQNGEVSNIEFTGFSVQNSLSWEDPRSEEERERMC